MSRNRGRTHLQGPDHTHNTNEEAKARIAVRAYFLAKNRQFEPGHELDDWIEAESYEAPDPGMRYPSAGFQS